LSEQCKHILSHAVAEAELLRHDKIGTEHLLLGMLGETKTLAAEILDSHGLNLDAVREKVALRPRLQDAHTASHPLPEAGVVPDAETAIRIAEAVWTPIYGEEVVKQQRPLEADLSSSVWTVRGTCQSEQAANILVAAISRTDGRILKIGTSVFRQRYKP
jgi:ATP-dependent Clp protease ATP-binding subunit ClpA